MSSKYWIWALCGVIVVLSTLLVVGRHFEASWAGGEGFVPASAVVVLEDEKTIDVTCEGVDSSRENILTCSGEQKKVSFGNATIWMDENTSLVVTDHSQGSEALTFYGGRIVVEGFATLHVRDLEFNISGKATLVNYGWLNRLDVYAIDGDLSGASTVVASGSAVRFDTLVPYDDPEAIEANYKESSAAAFYTWVENH